MRSVSKFAKLLVNCIISMKYADGDYSGLLKDLNELISDGFITIYRKNDLTRSFEALIDKVAESCETSLDKMNVQNNEKEHYMYLLTGAINGLNYVDLKEYVGNVDGLKKRLIQSNPYKNEIESADKDVYEQMVGHISNVSIHLYKNMPFFTTDQIELLVSAVNEISNNANSMLKKINFIEFAVNPNNRFVTYEAQYRNNILNKYGYIYLFGAGSVDENYKKYKLESAFIKLEVGVTEKNIGIDKIFVDYKNPIWLRGEAGSGKTTCLSWIAVQAASNALSELANHIPIVIELRKFSKKIQELSLISCVNEIMQDSSYKMPEGWIENVISEKRLLLLIDGFDEITPQERIKVFDWFRENNYIDAGYAIFSARPMVSNHHLFIKTVDMKLAPMTKKQRNDFVIYWHRAVLYERLKKTEQETDEMTDKLFEMLRVNKPLRELAANPLLCAMICALHASNGPSVPNNKRELYERCCELLLRDRNTEKGISEGEICLDYEQKKNIMGKIAYHMMKNSNASKGSVECKQVELEDYLKVVFNDLRIAPEITPRGFIDFIIERAALLQVVDSVGPVNDGVVNKVLSFIHRTFQEYLCANEIARQKDWGYLCNHVLDPFWCETISIAIGYANRENADEIITRTCEDESLAGLLLAEYYLAGTLEVSHETRTKLQYSINSKRHPRNAEQATELIKAGPSAVRLVNYDSSRDSIENEWCIYVLSRISTYESYGEMIRYLPKCLDNLSLNSLQLIEDATREIYPGNERYIKTNLTKYLKSYPGNVAFKVGWNWVKYYCEDGETMSFPKKVIIDGRIKRGNSYYRDIDTNIELESLKDLFAKTTSLCLLGDVNRERILHSRNDWKKLYLDKGLSRLEANSVSCEELWVDVRGSVTKSNRDWIKWINGIKKVVLYGAADYPKAINNVLFRGMSRDIKVMYIKEKEPIDMFFM